ncbi:MAG: hypothetical protein JXQ75_06320 [Phycisphaerae bacterium]|nr:hypothetical protein [Phycisphaerae bacterium]
MLATSAVVLMAFAIGQSAPADPPGGSRKERPNEADGLPRRNADDPSQPVARKAKREDGRRSTPPRNMAVKAMKMVIENGEFDEMPFEDFVEWLGRTTKANVVVRWKILEEAGVERDGPITLKHGNINVRKLLRLVFAQLTEELRDVELAAKADGNTLIVSTRKDINTKLIARTYAVQDLLIVVPDFTGRRIDDVGPGGSGFQLGKSGVSGGEKKAPEPVNRLVHMITGTIQPSSWRVNGGRGTIVYFKGQLVVRNNLEVHQLLGELLGEPGSRTSTARRSCRSADDRHDVHD